MSASTVSPAKARGMYLSVQVQNPKAGVVVAELSLRTERRGQQVGEVRYYVAHPETRMLGSMHLYGRNGYDERGDEAAMVILERALGQLTFRRCGIKAARPVGTPMTKAEQRVRRDVAFRLALDARDAYAAELAELRERVEVLEQRVRHAEQETEAWQDVATQLQELSDAKLGLTQGGDVVVLSAAPV